MSVLKAGFARIDITPPLGIPLQGYAETRLADGILDPLLVSALAVNDGKNTAIIISADLVGMDTEVCNNIRKGIAEATGTAYEAIFLCCVHTHLGPSISRSRGFWFKEEYVSQMSQKFVGAARMAVDDLKEAKMYINDGYTPVQISFIRRFRLKDGTVKTNPGIRNPEIDHPLGTEDQRVGLVYFKRENAPEIALVNFQVHADVIGGKKISADFPKFVRDTYEAAIPNSLCMFINGAEGDSNHINVNTPEGGLNSGYEYAKHMGRTIGGTAIALRGVAREAESVPVCAFEKEVIIPYRNITDEQLEKAEKINALHNADRDEEILPEHERTILIYESRMMVNLRKERIQSVTYRITGISIGDFAIVGFPGEPFTALGLQIRDASRFPMTYVACCANGYEEYLLPASAYEEGGYEARTSAIAPGGGELFVSVASEVLNCLFEQKA